MNPEDGRQDSGSRLCCNPYTEYIDDGDDDDLQMFDDADAVNRSLPIVENTVHGLMSIISSFVILLVKQCITCLFYENLVMLVHSVV